jgi:hypothetical protein
MPERLAQVPHSRRFADLPCSAQQQNFSVRLLAPAKQLVVYIAVKILALVHGRYNLFLMNNKDSMFSWYLQKCKTEIWRRLQKCKTEIWGKMQKSQPEESTSK